MVLARPSPPRTREGPFFETLLCDLLVHCSLSVPMRQLFVFAALLATVAPLAAQPAVFGSTSATRLAMSTEQGRYLDAIHGYEVEPRLVTADAQVTDVNRQTWSGSILGSTRGRIRTVAPASSTS